MYQVLHDFFDLTQNDHLYKVGDLFPLPDYEVTQERIAELSSDKNKLGKPLIVAVSKEAEEKTIQSQPKKRGKKQEVEDVKD